MDCNKTISFLAELNRLCNLRTRCVAGEANEEQCPLLGRCEDALTKICIEDATKLVEIVQKWSDEHPKKTYAQDFFKKFPDAPIDKSFKEKCPWVCRMGIYGGECSGIECDECWNKPMEE